MVVPIRGELSWVGPRDLGGTFLRRNTSEAELHR